MRKLKEIKSKILKNIAIYRGYQADCRTYCKWEYNNPLVVSKNAIEAKILRQTHVIEKGMALSNPREGFGVQKALGLLDMIDSYCAAGYKIDDSTPVKNALGVIKAYLEFHKERGFEPKEVALRVEKLAQYVPKDCGTFGIIEQKLSDLSYSIHGEFPEFFSSRHSVRQFSEKPIEVSAIRDAVAIAIHAPSACNRQSCKVYFYQSEEKNSKIGGMIAGNTGFAEEVRNYLIITSDISSFYDSFERNQVYVDGGIFSLALVEALHYEGIASCILQNGESAQKDKALREICENIPQNEKIILFIAIGYYKDNVVFATSHRKKLDEVLIVE